MEPKKVSITQLIADGHTFYVPFYQRAYVWPEKLWNRFIKDMEYISKMDEEYFIGSVILKKKERNEQDSRYETQKWDVVDGQQRLTTLAILYKVISLKNPSAHNPFDKRFRMEDNKLNIKHSYNDKEAFYRIASLTEDIEIANEGQSNLIAAYNYFRKNVDVKKIDHIKIQKNLWFISIYLEPYEKEHKIFDTINSISLKLNTEELLKNYLFTSDTLQEYLSIWKPIFEANDTCLNYWKTEYSFARTGKKTLSDRFFHILLQIIMHDPRNNIQREYREEFRKYDDDNKFDYYQKIIESGNWSYIEFAKEIVKYAQLFRIVFTGNEIKESSDSYKTPLNRLLLAIYTLDVHTAIPYILYILRNVDNKTVRNEIFSLLESYIVRRVITGAASNNYSDLFTESLIGQQICTYDGLCDYLGNKESHESLHMPYNSEVEDGIKTNKKLSTEKAKGILYLMESKLRENFSSQTALLPFSQYTLEHLMPQKWDTNWKAPSELPEAELKEFTIKRNSAIASLGNLAIITQGLNTKASNKAWREKLSSGLKEKAADLITMKEVIKKKSWNEDTIEERAIWLADHANEIWFNNISVEDVDLETKEKTNGKKKRSPNKLIRIEYPNGDFIQKEKANETLIEFIRRTGCNRVKELNIKVDYNNLVSEAKDGTNSSEFHKVDDKWFINTHSSSQAKVKQIKTISEALGLQIKVHLL
ncbi:MAG: DUF262 domain-containing protein [Prevotella sp.]|nr:DUF262 domain-containing protein [Prevotella sp.]